MLIDNRSAFEKNRPQSMYIGVIYNLDGIDWKIDIRYLNPSDAWAEDDLKRIKSRLTSEKIQMILEIKTAFHSHPKYRKEISGYEIYNAVLDKNISTVDEFNNYLKDRGVEL
jgi:type I restriction-modification system DNA methylase subunit